jgi:hypothetical protein
LKGNFVSTTNILHPSRYHGFGAKPPYFEGWYYKLVSKDQNHKYAVIPGVYLSPKQNESHSFIQIFNSDADAVQYHRYPIEDFEAEKELFRIQIGPNIFTSDRISLDIDDDLGKVHGSLKFKNMNPWPVKAFSPGAMGWFAWVPFMECYHGVVSMDHSIQGTLKIDETNLDFSGGRGYIEKDWGKQFPSAWIWGQSNHFDRPGVSLMMSVAVIPWLGSIFGGFIIGLLYEGKILRFATYNRGKIDSIGLDDQEVRLEVKNTGYRLKIRALRVEGGLLQAPTKVEMGRRIMETLNAKIAIRLETQDGEILYEGTGENAGLETVGDLNKLIEMIE